MTDCGRRFAGFKREVLENFKSYDVHRHRVGPEIEGGKRFAVVFEKVETGGKAPRCLRAVTAMYKEGSQELRRDWYGKDGEHGRQYSTDLSRHAWPAWQRVRIIAEVSNTDFLHAVFALHTRQRRPRRRRSSKARSFRRFGKTAIALLNLPLAALTKYQAGETGFVGRQIPAIAHIYRVFDRRIKRRSFPLRRFFARIGV